MVVLVLPDPVKMLMRAGKIASKKDRHGPKRWNISMHRTPIKIN
jgi:hypothetical protein